MAKDKATNKGITIPSSKSVSEIERNIEKLENDTSKQNSSVVFATIERNEEQKLLAWIEKVGIEAYNLIGELTKKAQNLAKPDIPGKNVHNGEMNFTKTEPEYSDERISELQKTHKALETLVGSFDTAMMEGNGSVANWKLVEAAIKNAKK